MRIPIDRYLIVALFLGVGGSSAFGGDKNLPPRWERFRGPNGAGTSDDKNVPLKFSASENVLWKIELPGGNSSPIVWGNHLFVHATSKDGKERSLVCLDAGNGKLRWQKTMAAAPAKIRADSSFASSTPTTDGNAVYVSFWDGKNVHISAYDFDGNAIWTKNLGVFNSQHGPGASPILYKDKLILAHDMDKDDFDTKVPNVRPSTLLALDKRTGKLVWESSRTAERACYSAPLLFQRGEKEPELVITSTTAVTGYNPENGEKLWEAKGWQEHALKSPLRTVATPALNGNVLCVCSGGDAGRFAMGLDLSDPKTPKRAWENRKELPYVPSPLTRGDHFYIVNDAGMAACYHARTGERVWFERLSEAGFHASPVLIDGKIYAASTTGDVFVLAAEPKYRLLARNELGEVIRATPAVAGGRLYVRGDRHLYCIGNGR